MKRKRKIVGNYRSLESCLTQIVGVFLGALAGVLLRMMQMLWLASTAIGIVLVAHMEVLCRMKRPGRLSKENRRQLSECGTCIVDERISDGMDEADIVTNYHVSQILALSEKLLMALRRMNVEHVNK